MWLLHQGALGIVLERSRQLCLTRYEKDSLAPDAAHRTLARWGETLDGHQTSVFDALLSWRDAAARRCDESVSYVLPRAQLRTLAKGMPVTASQLKRLLGR